MKRGLLYSFVLIVSISFILLLFYEKESLSRRLSADVSWLTGENLRTINGRVPLISCPPGYYRPSGSTDLLMVNGGQRENGCAPCPRGRYGESSGLKSSSCTAPCPAGTYSTRLGLQSKVDCELCPPGRWGTAPGQTTPGCTGTCPLGKYSNAFGATTSSTCQKCLAGMRIWQCIWSVSSRKSIVDGYHLSSPKTRREE